MYYDGEWNENWEEKYEISLNFYKDMYRVPNYIDVEKREKLELDEFVYDMHTSEGKKRGKSKEDFKKEGCYVLNENEEYLRNDWKNFYVNFVGKSNEKKNGKRGGLNMKEIEKREKLEKKEREKREKLEKKEREKREKLEKKEREKREKLEKKEREKREKLEKKEREKREKLEKKEREKLGKKKVVRRKKSKKEDELNFVENKELLVLDESEIKLCSDVVCGNKVVCFEYEGKIYKEGRKSMNYNLDYYVFDRCKEFFGLNCIGMELRLGKFRIVKKDKSILSYKDNWRVEETDEDVVYAVMEKIGNCEMLIERKKEVVKNANWLKEYCKIGMVRGIFRVSDFNMRNVLIDGNGEFVSIDENDILGKRKDVFGMKNRAVLKELKKNENVLMELLQEIWEVDFDAVEEIVKRFGFDGEKIRENWMKLEEDVRKELNF
jgi:flagellar biosynthesis GTPase FlhF